MLWNVLQREFGFQFSANFSALRFFPDEESRQSFSLSTPVRQRMEKGPPGGEGDSSNSGGAWANLMSSYKELKGEFDSLKRMQASTHAAYVETASRLAVVDQENGRMRAQVDSMRHEHRQVGDVEC